MKKLFVLLYVQVIILFLFLLELSTLLTNLYVYNVTYSYRVLLEEVVILVIFIVSFTITCILNKQLKVSNK